MYAKVFRQIYESSIAEDYETRHVFMDMLVLADSDGVVDMTQEAIARITNVPIEKVKTAILKLENVDNRSRTPDHNGCRLIRLDDHRDWGWLIVNYGKFRGTATEEKRREQTRLRVRKLREKQALEKFNKTNGSNVCNALHTVTSPSPSPSSYALQGGVGGETVALRSVTPPPTLKVVTGNAVGDFEKFWAAYPKKVAKFDAEHAWVEVNAVKHVPQILQAIKIQSLSETWTKDNGRFIPNPATWLRDGRWNDAPASYKKPSCF